MAVKKIYLNPISGRKSFYNKCFVQVIGNAATLYSYDTKICTWNIKSGELTKFKDFNYSRTTKRHQAAFFSYYGIPV